MDFKMPVNFDFPPQINSVEIQSGVFEVRVTSSRIVSSLLWEISSTLQEFGIFKKSRLSETELGFIANPGYTQNDVLSLIIVCSYIAATWQEDIVNYLKVKNHYARFNEMYNTIKLGKYIRLHNDANALRETVTIEDFKKVTNKWLVSQIFKTLKNSKYDCSAFDPQITGDRVKTAEIALNKLQFFPAGSPFITDAEILRRINTVNKALIQLRTDHERANFIYNQFKQNLESETLLSGPFIAKCNAVLNDSLEISEVISTFEKLINSVSVIHNVTDEMIKTLEFDIHKSESLMSEINTLAPIFM